ncbi:cytochrome D ubiquinol oxidase subunit II [Chryseobacterium lactis]|uniref:Cytochrome D Ubiquinol oxidase subunit II n=1 Tax=Chryseobacterium lactis TaxID=1241981 RepID=A0A3G6RSE8_CHRLC|nr:cytochrome d ubiquinol oxidase subunit II [Chryseobacterium lactis]AZA84024.1 cytochrome d ubiquinol oxidase subunit II [Chryseobacterium lactis]AZB04410.1 cytochrome d ubiquinol oxidase subunit II [Chryseobacterium lactis]PNW12579.1 cytochrome D ubiquinol oxidase subunit II [Chryseobacterium lactis]
MFYIVLAFLWISTLLYVIMGGADFGAGIVEFFSRKRAKGRVGKIMYHAMGPIWEANHMWLILIIVILFVGFPDIYTTAATYLYIPLIILLLGIVARGTAFGFRHYDAIQDNMQKLYTKVYVYSCLIAPLFLGIIAGSIVSGKIDTQTNNFMDAYVYSWLGLFPILTGVYTIAIFGFIASIFIIKETGNNKEEKNYAIFKAKQMSIVCVVLAVCTYIAAYRNNIPLAEWLLGNPVSLTCIMLCSLSFIWMWYLLLKKDTYFLRIIAGSQITLLFTAITYSLYPTLVRIKGSKGLSLLTNNNDQSVNYLGAALLLGSIFIMPSFIYLVYGFSKKKFW